MLSERNQAEKIMYYIVPFTPNIQNKSRDKKQVCGCQEVGREEQRVTNWEGFPFTVRKMSWTNDGAAQH